MSNFIFGLLLPASNAQNLLDLQGLLQSAQSVGGLGNALASTNEALSAATKLAQAAQAQLGGADFASLLGMANPSASFAQPQGKSGVTPTGMEGTNATPDGAAGLSDLLSLAGSFGQVLQGVDLGSVANQFLGGQGVGNAAGLNIADLMNVGGVGSLTDLSNIGNLLTMGNLGNGQAAGTNTGGSSPTSQAPKGAGGLGNLVNLGGLANLGGLGNLANLGDLGGLDLTSLGSLPGIGDLSNLGNLGGLGGLNLGELPSLGGLGDLSGLGNLGDLANLGNLQDLLNTNTGLPDLTGMLPGGSWDHILNQIGDTTPIGNITDGILGGLGGNGILGGGNGILGGGNGILGGGNGIFGGGSNSNSGGMDGDLARTLSRAFITNGYLNIAGQNALKLSGAANQSAYAYPDLAACLNGQSPCVDNQGKLTTAVQAALQAMGINASTPETLIMAMLGRSSGRRLQAEPSRRRLSVVDEFYDGYEADTIEDPLNYDDNDFYMEGQYNNADEVAQDEPVFPDYF